MNPDDAKSAACSVACRCRDHRGRGELSASSKPRAATKPPKGLMFVPFFDEGRWINKLTLDATLSDLERNGFQEVQAVRVLKA